MTIEEIDSANDSTETLEIRPEHTETWNGRKVKTLPNHEASIHFDAEDLRQMCQEKAARGENPMTVFIPDSEIVCMRGEIGASASADTKGNKEVEAHVEVSNEKETVSVEAKGSVSQDAQGNTEGRVEGKIKYKF